MENLQELINSLLACNDNERANILNQIKSSSQNMIFHGSTISDLKEIEARKSSQKGSYVYGTPSLLYAAIFSVLQRTNKPFPPKFGWKDGEIYIIERFPNQFDSIANVSSSIYILNKDNFHKFDDHSESEDIEVRAEGNQKVSGELKVPNVLNFIKKNGVKLYSYDEREKFGIPRDDKYMVQGVLKTYLWKIEDESEEGKIQGKAQIENVKQTWGKYNDIIDGFVAIVDNLPKEERQSFVANVYDTKKEKFNTDVIHRAESIIKKNMSQSSNNERGSIQELNVVKKRVLKKDGFSSIVVLTLIFIISIFIVAFLT